MPEPDLMIFPAPVMSPENVLLSPSLMVRFAEPTKTVPEPATPLMLWSVLLKSRVAPDCTTTLDPLENTPALVAARVP